MVATNSFEISDRAIRRFDELWHYFDRQLIDFGGTYFLVYPYRPYFSQDFYEELTPKLAKVTFYRQLSEWGKAERTPATFEQTAAILTEHGIEFPGIAKPDRHHAWASHFIYYAFGNICCIGAHNRTIEQLIYEVREHKGKEKIPKESVDAVRKLLSLSKSFLLAEWMHELVSKAISNGDQELFKGISRGLVANTIEDKFVTTRQWVGTVMLWFLGGAEITPRRRFLQILKQKKIVSPNMEETSFLAMLSKLGLTKNLTTTKTRPKSSLARSHSPK